MWGLPSAGPRHGSRYANSKRAVGWGLQSVERESISEESSSCLPLNAVSLPVNRSVITFYKVSPVHFVQLSYYYALKPHLAIRWCHTSNLVITQGSDRANSLLTSSNRKSWHGLFLSIKTCFCFGSLKTSAECNNPVGTCWDLSRCAFHSVPSTLSSSSSVPQVEITLQDVNDNPPIFPNDVLDVTIEENVGDGFKIMQLTATDADEVTTPQLSLLPDSVFLPVFQSAAFWIDAPGVIALEMGLKLSSDSLECYYKFRRVVEARATVTVETVND